jgi:type IV secretion system protein VirB6
MFSWIGTQFTQILNSYATSVVASLMTALTPLALTLMTLWILLYGWAVLRNEVSETVPAFLWKVTKISLVLAFALQSSVYIPNVAESADALAMGVATTFVPAGADPVTVSSPYGLLDVFNDRANQLTLDLMKEAGITRLDLVFAAVVTAFGNVIFLCTALCVVSMAKLFLAFVIAIGPIFVLCLAWRPTTRFFDSWLSMVLNAVVLTWFAFFALGLSLWMGNTIVQTIHAQGGFLGPNFNVVGEALRYCVVMILMAVICFQAPSLASALTGGAAVQQGAQMMQNLLIVSGMRSSAGRGPDSPGSAAGGVMQRGVGPAYTAGRATSLAAAYAKRGVSAARAAAYKLAARRGRTS